VFASAAAAAAPPNDTFSGATPIGTPPFTTTEDTSQSTLDSADTAAGVACNAAGFQFSNSVWFSYTPTSNQVTQLGTSGTDYTTAIAVVTGSPAGFSSVSCSLGGAVFSANAGTTYYIDIVEFGLGSGGTLNLSLNSLPDPIGQFAVDGSGTFDKSSGSATVTGTITCSGAFTFGSGQVSTDAHGRNAAIGSGGFFGAPVSGLTCDGTPHHWSVTVTPASGQFKGGPVSATIDVDACNYFCTSRHVTQTVTLKQ
jgi:hypothetical protein